MLRVVNRKLSYIVSSLKRRRSKKLAWINSPNRRGGKTRGKFCREQFRRKHHRIPPSTWWQWGNKHTSNTIIDVDCWILMDRPSFPAVLAEKWERYLRVSPFYREPEMSTNVNSPNGWYQRLLTTLIWKSRLVVPIESSSMFWERSNIGGYLARSWVAELEGNGDLDKWKIEKEN